MVQFAHGRIQWLTTNAVGALFDIVTNFEPKAIRLYWVGLQSTATAANSQAVAERRGVGFISSTTSRACVGTFAADNSGNADCGSIWSNTQCVITVDGTGAKDGALDINTIDALGFQLIVDDVAPANITVFYEAWGGNEITDVTIGAIAEPAAIGTQNYTATGFVTNPPAGADQCIMFAGVQTVNATDTGQAQDSGLHVGCATTPLPVAGTIDDAAQWTICGNSDDGSATMDTDGYNLISECISMITIAGGNPNARARLTAFGTNIFTLDWLARATTNRRSIYMAIKGGEWRAGLLSINGNTLNSVVSTDDSAASRITFNVKGVSLMGAMKIDGSQGTSTTNDRIGFGSGISPTSRNSAAILDVDNIATSNINTSLYTTQVLVYPSTAGGLQTAYDINRLGANSFQLITDTAGGVAGEAIYFLTFGDKKITAGTIGHPFIF